VATEPHYWEMGKLSNISGQQEKLHNWDGTLRTAPTPEAMNEATATPEALNEATATPEAIHEASSALKVIHEAAATEADGYVEPGNMPVGLLSSSATAVPLHLMMKKMKA